MDNMFHFASSFNQNLCAWSDMLKSGITATNIFVETSCPFSKERLFVYASIPPSHICHSCS